MSERYSQTSRCLSLNSPIMYCPQVVMTPMAAIHRIPGTMPSVCSVKGSDRTPKPTYSSATTASSLRRTHLGLEHEHRRAEPSDLSVSGYSS